MQGDSWPGRPLRRGADNQESRLLTEPCRSAAPSQRTHRAAQSIRPTGQARWHRLRAAGSGTPHLQSAYFPGCGGRQPCQFATHRRSLSRGARSKRGVHRHWRRAADQAGIAGAGASPVGVSSVVPPSKNVAEKACLPLQCPRRACASVRRLGRTRARVSQEPD